MKKYLCSLNYSFPGIDSILNEEELSGMSKYNYFNNYISFFKWDTYFYSNDNSHANKFLFLMPFNRIV